MVGLRKLTSPILSKYLAQYQKNPQSQVFAPLAESYRKLGLIDQALDILRRGMRLHPNYPLAHLCLANCYFDLEKYDLCYKTLQPLVSKNLENLSLQKLFATACLKQARFEEALATYKYVLFLNPKDQKIQEQVKLLETQLEGGVPEKVQETSSPEKEVETVSLSDAFLEEDSRGLAGWVRKDFSQGNPEAEVEKTEEAEGWTFSEGSFPLPEKTKEKEREKSQDPVVTHTLVDLYCAQGYHEKGLEILQKILLLNPDDRKTQERLNQLQKMIGEKSQEGEKSPRAPQDEEENVQSVQKVFNLFLEKIKKRALAHSP